MVYLHAYSTQFNETTYIDYIPRQNDNRYTKSSRFPEDIKIRASDSLLVPDFFLAPEKQCGSKA